jgi:hypothetical protein
MLYDPKWAKQAETKADPFTLESLIAWLEKQPANSTYPFYNCRGECLFSQYLAHCGFAKRPVDYDREGFRGWDILHNDPLRGIAETEPWTFGAALKRARALADRA